MKLRQLGALTAALAGLGWSQTQLDLRTQSKNVDFSAASSTRPLKTGVVFPVTCSVGDLFYKSDQPAGANIYACTSPGVWTVESGGSGGGGGGATTASQLTDLKAVLSSPTNLLIGTGCSQTTPCDVRFGSSVFSFTGSASATINSGTGTLWGYISSAGTITVGHNLNVTCTVLCVAQSGVTAFPDNTIPLFSWTVTNGALDVLGGTDYRAFLSSKSVLPGMGINTLESGGATVVALDTAVVGLRVAAPAASTSVGTLGSWATDGAFFYICVATNLWKRVAISSW